MKKLLFPLFYPRFTTLAVALMMMFFFINNAKAVDLKKNSVIEGSVITLGDIFYNLPRNQDKVLGPAPRPGTNMVLNARTLMRVAQALDLPWRPLSSNDHIVIERAATLVSKDEIEERLTSAIKDSGHKGNFELSLPTSTTEIIMPQDQPGTFEISDLNVDTVNERFDAILYAPSKASPVQTMRISGAMHAVVDVPVLAGTMRNGHVIKARDITFQKERAKRLNHDVILNPENLIGMTPRRMVIEGQAIKVSEVEAPQIVRRGQNVTITFKSGAMVLTAMGKALENGSKGDLIRVVNANTSRTVAATITAEKEVRVQSF